MRRHWSLRGTVALVLAIAIWVGAGTGVYVYLGSHRSTVAERAQKPGEGQQRKDGPINHLPGTLYVVQDGALYQLQHGTFTPLLTWPGGAGGWTQPAVAPNGQSLLVVRRDYAFSDLYQVVPGHPATQLTHNASKTVELNHWAFYPRFTPDGGGLVFSYDAKDRFNSYNVVLSIYQMALGAALTQARKWTTPVSYTGGDLQPIPLASGGMVYTKYTFDQANSRILGQLWLTTKAGTAGRALTPAADDCSQPSLSPDGQRLAMTCTGGGQFANIEVAAFDGANIGPRQVLVSGQLASQPTWAPDGSGLVYLAPMGAGGHFQLWLQQDPQPPPPIPTPTARPSPSFRSARATATPSPTPVLPTPTPVPLPPPIQLTPDNDFDATSTIAWHA